MIKRFSSGIKWLDTLMIFTVGFQVGKLISIAQRVIAG